MRHVIGWFVALTASLSLATSVAAHDAVRLQYRFVPVRGTA